MTLNIGFYDLARETVVEPLKGFDHVVNLGLDARRAIELNILVVILTVLLTQASVYLVDAISDEPVRPWISSSGPLADTVFYGALNGFLIIGIWAMGRVTGRSTPLVDVALIYGWFQFLMVLAQAALIPITLIVPFLGAFGAVILAIFAQPYYLVCGVMAAHKFKRPLSVLGGLILVGVVTAMLLQPVMLMLGMEMQNLAEV
ncbi:MAG: hypothetical protein AAGJ34_04325 [Pseudomonadota bacterium]